MTGAADDVRAMVAHVREENARAVARQAQQARVDALARAQARGGQAPDQQQQRQQQQKQKQQKQQQKQQQAQAKAPRGGGAGRERVVHYPSEHMGVLIGKAGRSKEAIEQATGARLVFRNTDTRAPPGSAEAARFGDDVPVRAVRIRGKPEAVASAAAMLEEYIAPHLEGNARERRDRRRGARSHGSERGAGAQLPSGGPPGAKSGVVSLPALPHVITVLCKAARCQHVGHVGESATDRAKAAAAVAALASRLVEDDASVDAVEEALPDGVEAYWREEMGVPAHTKHGRPVTTLAFRVRGPQSSAVTAQLNRWLATVVPEAIDTESQDHAYHHEVRIEAWKVGPLLRMRLADGRGFEQTLREDLGVALRVARRGGASTFSFECPSSDDAERAEQFLHETLRSAASRQGEQSRSRQSEQLQQQRFNFSDSASRPAQPKKRAQQQKEQKEAAARRDGPVILPEAATLRELASLFGVPALRLRRVLDQLDMASDNSALLSMDVAELVAAEVGVETARPERRGELTTEEEREATSEYKDHPPRAPVVAVMGHVDHGKTTLLDALRSSSVAAAEAGGITQHVGAFVVDLPESGRSITVLDTPGHAAFAAMRERGAQVTDVAVVVVAADDGVMPQTEEVLNTTYRAGIPIVVAINKCDKPGADPAAVREELATRYNVALEGHPAFGGGGDVQHVEISALKRTGLRELEEAVMLQAEIMELRGDPDEVGHGVVIESRVKKGRGTVCTTVVTKGSLTKGDYVVIGSEYGRVKLLRRPGGGAMGEERGGRQGAEIKRAGPSEPVEVYGLDAVPEAGETLMVVGSERRAREVARERQFASSQGAARAMVSEAARRSRAENEEREMLLRARRRQMDADFEAQGFYNPRYRAKLIALKLEEEAGDETRARAAEAEARSRAFADGVIEGELECVPVIVKADVAGTNEALVDMLNTLSSRSPLPIKVLRAEVGVISDGDVREAAGQGAAVVGFNVGTSGKAVERLAEREGVLVLRSRVIYELIHQVGEHVAGLLPGRKKIVKAGDAEVAALFEVKGKRGEAGTKILGVRVADGKLLSAGHVRVLRDGEVVHEGAVTTLRRGDKAIKEAVKGSECGLVLQGFSDAQVGDTLECMEMSVIKTKVVQAQDGSLSFQQ